MDRVGLRSMRAVTRTPPNAPSIALPGAPYAGDRGRRMFRFRRTASRARMAPGGPRRSNSAATGRPEPRARAREPVTISPIAVAERCTARTDTRAEDGGGTPAGRPRRGRGRNGSLARRSGMNVPAIRCVRHGTGGGALRPTGARRRRAEGAALGQARTPRARAAARRRGPCPLVGVRGSGSRRDAPCGGARLPRSRGLGLPGSGGAPRPGGGSARPPGPPGGEGRLAGGALARCPRRARPRRPACQDGGPRADRPRAGCVAEPPPVHIDQPDTVVRGIRAFLVSPAGMRTGALCSAT
jgi:hypothetical protein